MCRIDHFPCRLTTALDVERNDAAASLLLALCQFMLRMRRQAGVVDALHFGMLLEPARQLERRLRVCSHANSQRFQPLQDHPGVERRQRGTAAAQKTIQAFEDYVTTAENGTAQHPALTIEIFGRRMDDDVGTEIKRSLQDRRAETIVHDQQRAVGAGYFCKRGNIGNFCEWIGWRFQEQHPRIRFDCPLPCGDVGRTNERGFHAEALQDIVEQLHGRAKQALRGDNMLAALHQSHYAGEDCRHPGRGGDTALRALQRGQAFLKGSDRRIGVARIHHAGVFAGKARCRFGRIPEYEARGQVQRLGMLVELAAMNARAHCQRLEIQFVPPHRRIPLRPWFRHGK